jgi:hypothetical protein
MSQRSRAKKKNHYGRTKWREDEMAVDAVLWFILGGMIAFLGYGCFRTARH